MQSPEIVHLRPCDDFHIHLRQGQRLKFTVPHAATQFRRALVMPNLKPPVTTTADALKYRKDILKHVPQEFPDFTPLMTLYLTDKTSPEEIRRAKDSGHVVACKLYPAGATTNSENGVTDISKIYPTLKAMQEHGILLLVHGEVTNPKVDIFDREAAFIKTVMEPLVEDFPRLKVVMEHVTSKQAVEFVRRKGANVGATITAHHLRISRNDIFKGGICPHMYCLPICKTESDREALVEAATSGSPKFFAGTDSAPHPIIHKERYRGFAGIYTAHAAIEIYAMTFAESGSLDKLEDFLSGYGADFYGLKRNDGHGPVLLRQPCKVPKTYDFPMESGMEKISPFLCGETLPWSLCGTLKNTFSCI